MSPEKVSPEKEGEGIYLYCVANNSEKTSFGEMGIDDSKVYTIPYKDISGIVHRCSAKPYESKDEKIVKEWILSHQYIIDEATKKFGTVIPFSFDTIVKGDDDALKNWLSKDYNVIKEKLNRLRDKAEYTVQIFCDQESIIEQIEKNDNEIKKMREMIKTKPKGVARLLSKKLEKIMKDEFKKKIDGYAKGFYAQVKDKVDKLKIEPNKKVPGKWSDKQMIINLTCLVHKDKVKGLGEELGEINKSKEFVVRFTGPWAPFSFVGKPIGEGRRVG